MFSRFSSLIPGLENGWLNQLKTTTMVWPSYAPIIPDWLK